MDLVMDTDLDLDTNLDINQHTHHPIQLTQVHTLQCHTHLTQPFPKPHTQPTLVLTQHLTLLTLLPSQHLTQPTP